MPGSTRPSSAGAPEQGEGLTLQEILDADRIAAERWYDIDSESARVLNEVTRRLDDDQVLNHPLLLVGMLFSSHLGASAHDLRGPHEQMLERLAALIDRSSTEQKGRDWSTLRMIAARWRGEYARAAELMKDVRASRPTESIQIGLEEARPGQARLQCGLTEVLVGNFAAALDDFRRAYGAAGWPPRRHFAGVNAAANAAMITAINGDHLEAEKWMTRAAGLGAVPTWCEDLLLVGVQIAKAKIAVDRRNREAADDEVANLRSKGGGFEVWPLIAAVDIDYELAFGSPERAFEILKHIEFERNISLESDPIADRVLTRAYVDTLITLGEGNLALRVANESGGHPRLHLPKARIWLAAGDGGRATRFANIAVNAVGTPAADVTGALLVRAAIDAAAGEHGRAARTFAHIYHRLAGEYPGLFCVVPFDQLVVLCQLAELPVPDLGAEASTPALHIIYLTSREREVLELLASGLKANAIAERRILSPHTVRAQIKQIYRKLQVNSAQEALTRAAQVGILRDVSGRL